MKRLWDTFQRLFAQVVERIETNPATMGQHVALFLGILSVRLCLEFFSNNRLYNLWDVLNTGLWFVFIVLAFLLQLWAGSKVEVGRVARLVVSGFGIALTAPILDLAINGTVGATRMSYLMGEGWAEIAFSYITIGGRSLSRGATLGIRIEIVLLVLATFHYVRLKTGSVAKALFWAWMIYTVLFASGWVPKLVGGIAEALDLSFAAEDQSAALALLCADLVLFGLVLHAHRWKTLLKAWQSVPWPGVLPHAGLLGLGAILALQHYPENWALNPTTMYLPFLALVALSCLLLGLGLARMPMEDQEVAQRLKPWVLAGMLASALAVSGTWIFVVMVAWGLVLIQYDAPLRLGRVPGIRHLLTGMSAVASLLLGHVLFAAPMIGVPGKWIFAALGLGISGALLIDAGATSRVSLIGNAPWPGSRWHAMRMAAILWVLAGGWMGWWIGEWQGMAWLGMGCTPAALAAVFGRSSWMNWMTWMPAASALAYIVFGGW